MPKRLTERHIGVTLQLTGTVIDRIEAFRKRMQDQMPGLHVSTSDAARVVIMRGLDESFDEDE